MLTIDTPDSFRHVPSTTWDMLIDKSSPFLEHGFLLALEEAGCATVATGWEPRPVLIYDGEQLVGAAPAWKKTHSMGEFVYDQGWANWVEQKARLPYYPKLVIGVPFTPVTGPRLFTKSPEVLPTLLQGVAQVASDCMSTNFLFNTALEAEQLTRLGWFSRIQYQFHWKNDGYQSWDDFLQKFSSKDRNKLRRERKEVAHLDIQSKIGATSDEMDALYQFYVGTTHKHVWGQQYLNREWFHRIHALWKDRLHTVIVRENGIPVAGAFNVWTKQRLYGRYWGAAREIPFLHFEVCYHQGIEFAIAHGLEAFEPGHGGEHKYRRGFLPEITWSSHQFHHPKLHQMLTQVAAQETDHVRTEIEAIHGLGKLKTASIAD